MDFLEEIAWVGRFSQALVVSMSAIAQSSD